VSLNADITYFLPRERATEILEVHLANVGVKHLPLHRMTFNGIVDVPFGKGRRYASGSNKFVNALIGGYQMAFVGTVVANGNFGETNPIEIYKRSKP